MSTFDNALDVLQSANDIKVMNGAGTIDGAVPDLRETTLISGNPIVHNHTETIEPEIVSEPETIVQSISDYTRLVNSYNVGNGQQHDAFAPIEKQQLQNNDGALSMGHNIRILQDGKFVEVGVVTGNYLAISNEDLHQHCEQIRMQTGLAWTFDKMMFNGKHFKCVYRTESLGIPLENLGDTAHIMFTEMNSYDGSSPAGFRIDFMVLSCLNGMVSPTYGFGTTFRHTLQNVNWRSEIDRSTQMVIGDGMQNRLKTFATHVDKLNTRINMDELNTIRNVHIPKLNSLRYGEILTRFHKTEGETAWDLCQAGTDTLWHRNKRNAKVTKADFDNNGYFVDGMLEYGKNAQHIVQS
tara:strand:+ start:1500 stop:2558 length:1059 start_codon:yes stop_codon:yes gene_type:complete